MFGSVVLVMTLGDRDLAQAVWTESLKGDYVLKPEQFAGERPVRFVLPPEDDPPNRRLQTHRKG